MNTSSAKERRILVISVAPGEATYRLRVGILPALLEKEGFSFDIRPRPKWFLARAWLAARSGRYDAVVVQRKLLDPSHAWLLRHSARRVFFDLDDAVMVQRREIGRWSRWLKQRRYLATARAADRIVAGNEYLGDQFRELGRPVTVLPTVVDERDYPVKTHAPTKTPTLVWIGSASTLPYLHQWMPTLEAAAARVPGLRLLTIASEPVRSNVLTIEHVRWSRSAEAAALQHGDIGIAPTPLDRWTVGKSGFKIIQYMASGLPTIASPVGANAQIVEEPVTGLLPATMDEWPAAIARLAEDVSLRARMGAAARQRVVERYTLETARRVWTELLNGG